MSDTPVFDNLVAEMEFANRRGTCYRDDPPSRPMQLENMFGQRIHWNGKRWYGDGDDGSLQTQECWPPDDYYGPVLWREVTA